MKNETKCNKCDKVTTTEEILEISGYCFTGSYTCDCGNIIKIEE